MKPSSVCPEALVLSWHWTWPKSDDENTGRVRTPPQAALPSLVAPPPSSPIPDNRNVTRWSRHLPATQQSKALVQSPLARGLYSLSFPRLTQILAAVAASHCISAARLSLTPACCSRSHLPATHQLMLFPCSKTPAGTQLLTSKTLLSMTFKGTPSLTSPLTPKPLATLVHASSLYLR